MKLLLDFIPLLLFFGAYKLWGIYAGTAVLMGATCVQMAVIYAIDKKLSTMHKATLGLILIFGALTLALQDERFIKWKPTVLYAAMALALAVALWGYGKNLLKAMLGAQIALPEFAWYRLSIAWIVYCVFMAALNGYVAAYFSTDAWAEFKLWGYVFPLAFIVAQGFYVARHISEPEPSDPAQTNGSTPEVTSVTQSTFAAHHVTQSIEPSKANPGAQEVVTVAQGIYVTRHVIEPPAASTGAPE